MSAVESEWKITAWQFNHSPSLRLGPTQERPHAPAAELHTPHLLLTHFLPFSIWVSSLRLALDAVLASQERWPGPWCTIFQIIFRLSMLAAEASTFHAAPQMQ
jgi:hypothetical protein